MSAGGGAGAHLAPSPSDLASDGLPALPTPAELSTLMSSSSWRPPDARRTRRLLATATIVLFLGACALAILVLIGTNTGKVGFALGVCLAALPVPALLWCLRWLDRFEPEPRRLILFALAWGGAVATLAAIFLNRFGAEVLFDATPDGAIDPAAIWVAPPVEETAKGLLVLLLAWRRRIDGVIDGIFFAGLAGVGFAFTENILYFGRSYAEVAAQEGTSTGVFAAILVFIVRAVISPFAHPLFTMWTGVGIGVAVATRHRWLKVIAPLAGYATAMSLHGGWNALASSGLRALAIGYATVMLPVFAIAVALALWLRRREGRVVLRRLPAFVESGWLAPHEVYVLSSLRLRETMAVVARRVGGPSLERATRDYHALATTLAYERERIARGHRVWERMREQLDTLAAIPAVRGRAFVPPPPDVAIRESQAYAHELAVRRWQQMYAQQQSYAAPSGPFRL